MVHRKKVSDELTETLNCRSTEVSLTNLFLFDIGSVFGVKNIGLEVSPCSIEEDLKEPVSLVGTMLNFPLLGF